MRSLCAQPAAAAAVRASAAPVARLRAAAPLPATLPAHRRRCASLRVAARPVTASAAVSALALLRRARPADSLPAFRSRQAPPPLPFRVGHGFDLHRLAPGLKLILGGVDIPHTKGCEAHSDGGRPLYARPPCALGADCRSRTSSGDAACGPAARLQRVRRACFAASPALIRRCADARACAPAPRRRRAHPLHRRLHPGRARDARHRCATLH
jgi:hypothetical protein